MHGNRYISTTSMIFQRIGIYRADALLYSMSQFHELDAAMSEKPRMSDDARLLAAALLWMRNHYECDDRGVLIRDAVIRRADAVLKDFHPTGADIERLRTLYPR